jgi:hypothetical protein
MRHGVALILLVLACAWTCSANISFRPGGYLGFAPGGVIGLRGAVDAPTPTPTLSPDDVTATMTSATTPTPNVVYYVSTGGATGQAWRAFDHNITATSTGLCFGDYVGSEIGFDFGASFPHAIQKLRFMGLYANGVPKSFTVKGSNGGATDTLYIGTGTTSLDWQEFTWTNSTEYRYITFKTNSVQSGSSVGLKEIEYWETE